MNLSVESAHPARPTMSRRDIVLWWEKKRIPYNLLVGLAGLLSLILVVVAGSEAVKPGEDFEEPMGLVIIPILFGVMANLCYTAGWILDISFYSGKPSHIRYRIGLIFSMVLASLPGLWAVTAWLWTLHTGKKLD